MAVELAEPNTVLPTVTEQDYQRAVGFLETEAIKIAAVLSEKEQASIAALKRDATEFAAQIELHKTREPSAIIKTRAFKEKYANWQHQGKVNAAEYKNKVDHIQSLESGHLHTLKQAEINKQAYHQAEVNHPAQVKVIDHYQTDVQIAQLTSRLNQLEKTISEVRDSGNERKLPQLLSQKSTVLRTLNGKGLINERLGDKEKATFGKAFEASKKELSLFKDRGLVSLPRRFNVDKAQAVTSKPSAGSPDSWIDCQIAESVRVQGCRCGGVLHSARYPRKPRGVSRDLLGEPYESRLSFCCNRDGCRRRCTPPSVRFVGRRVYLGVVMTLAMAREHGLTARRRRYLVKRLGVSARVLVRWLHWWCQEFPGTRTWLALRGEFIPALDRSGLPGCLLGAVPGVDLADRLCRLLVLVMPLSTTSCAHCPRVNLEPQKMRM
ncbi:hypothetical protein GQR58_029184 [Nymphon striatum]|nr:hypothetical protein GQR58_029184 [Nymphon striatum]